MSGNAVDFFLPSKLDSSAGSKTLKKSHEMKETGNRILLSQAKGHWISNEALCRFYFSKWNWLPITQTQRAIEALSYPSRVFVGKGDLDKLDYLKASSFCSQQTHQK